MFQVRNLVGSRETPTILRQVLEFLNLFNLTKFPGTDHCPTAKNTRTDMWVPPLSQVSVSSQRCLLPPTHTCQLQISIHSHDHPARPFALSTWELEPTHSPTYPFYHPVLSLHLPSITILFFLQSEAQAPSLVPSFLSSLFSLKSIVWTSCILWPISTYK